MKLRFDKLFFLCFIMVFLISCVKRERITDQDRLKIKIHTARLSDIPMPLGIRPMLEYISDNSFAYTTDDNTLDLLQYYTVEMDQYGWNLVVKFDAKEQFLIFEKPHRLASILIRKQNKQLFVVILTNDK